MAWEGAQKCADILKYAGYNYGEKLYDEHHREHPAECFSEGAEPSHAREIRPGEHRREREIRRVQHQHRHRENGGEIGKEQGARVAGKAIGFRTHERTSFL